MPAAFLLLPKFNSYKWEKPKQKLKAREGNFLSCSRLKNDHL